MDSVTAARKMSGKVRIAVKVIVRGALFALALALFTNELVKSYNHLDEEKIGTEVRLVNNLRVDPPAITVCKASHEKYDIVKLNKSGLWNGMEETMEGYKLMLDQNMSLRSALESSCWHPEDVVYMVEAYDVVAYVNYGYNGDNAVELSWPLNDSDSTSFAHWHFVHSPIYGRCQQLIIKKEAFRNFRSALSLIKMNFLAEKYEHGLTSWLVFLHAPYHFGTGEEVIPVAKGYILDYDVSAVTIEHENTSEKPCLDTKEKDPDYQREDCILHCLEKTYLEKNGCQFPAIKSSISGDAPDCDYIYYRTVYPDLDLKRGMSESDKISAMLSNLTFVQEECGCPQSCSGKAVTTSVNTKERFGTGGDAILVLKFPSTAEVFREFLTYNVGNFFSDCGAYFGVFLGASVYGLHDAVSDFIIWIAAKVNGKERNLTARRKSKSVSALSKS